MKAFLGNELEPISYLIYAMALLLYISHAKLLRFKVLFWYYLCAALMLYAGIVYSDNNNWTYNILFLVNICLASWYYHLLANSRPKQTIAVVGFAVNVIVFAYRDLFQNLFNQYNSNVYGISFITIVLYSLLYLHQLIADVREGNLLLNFDFWLICGYLLYFLGSFVIVLYYNEKTFFKDRRNMWCLHNMILFICSLVTLWASVFIIKKTRVNHA